MLKCLTLAIASLLLSTSLVFGSETDNELSYDSQVDSTNRFKCLYGYFASKTGDHQTAIAIFEDCIERWQDVYSMIWLAHLYENGSGVEKDTVKAFELLQLGANTKDAAGYSSLAKYHYGVALFEGKGTLENINKGTKALREAAHEGVASACDYLELKTLQC